MKRWKKNFLTVAAVVALLGIAAHIVPLRLENVSTVGPTRFASSVVIVDAGHGGEDGGAVSPNGTIESNINLAVALRMDQLFGLYGVNVLMLRSMDVSLHHKDAETLRQKKVSDLHNRVAMIEAAEGATLISIHQNSYPSQRYHGAQVFFAPTPGSQELASVIQETLRTALDEGNSRQAAKIPESVYLMNHITCRAVLVECGFLTNPAEEKLLTDSAYQTKLAAALCGAYLQGDREGENRE